MEIEKICLVKFEGRSRCSRLVAASKVIFGGIIGLGSTSLSFQWRLLRVEIRWSGGNLVHFPPLVACAASSITQLSWDGLKLVRYRFGVLLPSNG